MDISTLLSTASRISDAVQHNTAEYSTVDVMGSLINNAKFKRGYDEFQSRRSLSSATPDTYIWCALSAISQELGQSVYANIKHYIDNVSNVDTCKIHALKSMMSMLAVDYTVLDKIGYYPIEIQNLIDLLSISKKYLLSNKFIKQDFLDSLVSSDTAVEYLPSALLSTSSLMPSGYTSSDVSNFMSSSNDYYMLSSDEAYKSYLSGVYATFISDMITMHGVGLCSNVEIYKTLTLADGYGANSTLSDKYEYRKKINNIPMSFNVEQIVNGIELGDIYLSDYNGPQLSLLNDEIAYRNSPATSLSSLDLTTRGLYYRKQKVIEYADFVDNMSFLPQNYEDFMTYQYDKSYLLLSNNSIQNNCISNIGMGERTTIVSSDILNAAKSLAYMTQYIAKLRESIKLQTRKIFMKGTNNLLRFAANEFLIDYINVLKNSAPSDVVSSIVSKLSAHSVNDVAIQEYDDITEYMNLSTVSTNRSVAAKYANDRFFDNSFENVNGLLVPQKNNAFTNEEINNFYLNDLNLANTLHPVLTGEASKLLSSNFYEFLSVLFDVAANPSYYSKSGQFGTILSNDVMTYMVDDDLSCMLSIQDMVSGIATSANFEFNTSSTIESQVNDFDEAAFNLVRDAMLDGISSIYDEYSPITTSISSNIDVLRNEFITYITKTQSHYFCKSDNIYNYDATGAYMYPYYVGNPDYRVDSAYIMSSASAREWINDDHCYTFSVSGAVYDLSSEYDSNKRRIDSIIDDISEKYNFIDPASDYLDDQMNSIQSFIQQNINARRSYIQSIVDSLRNQANAAKQEYDNIKNTFSTVLASLPSIPNQNFYMKAQKQDDGGGYNITTKRNEDVIFDEFSQEFYKESSKKTTFFVKKSFSPDKYTISPDDALDKQMATCLDLLEVLQDVSYGQSSAPAKSFGTQAITIKSLQASLQAIGSKILPNIVSQIKDLFADSGFDENEYGKSSNTTLDKINFIIKYLTSQISDAQFMSDEYLSSYHTIMTTLNQISGQYVPSRAQYEALWTQFDSFFSDYPKGSNYKLYIPSNLSAIDDFRKKKDSVALNQINQQFDQYDATYENLVKQFQQMCDSNKIMLYQVDHKQHRYLYNGDFLEAAVVDFLDALNVDIEVKEQIAKESAYAVVDDINDNVDRTFSIYRRHFAKRLLPVSEEIDYRLNFNNMVSSFADIVDELVDTLNYYTSEDYEKSKLMFQNYSGMVGVATDPYYNMKNVTHPTYQIHPFLWNLIEHHASQSAIDMISKKIINIDYDKLEADAVSQTIDGLLGKFGNVIDKWRNNINDFTGYTTRYESSNHISKYTGRYSEVIGYDGAFYPPAIDKYRSLTRVQLSSLMDYYSHLNIEADSNLSTSINNALIANYPSISKITNSYESKDDVYDIYKYCTDQYDNAYILYKKYSQENPSEQDKLMTQGELWIRLVDTPIAFPLSTILEADDNQYENLSATKIYDICMMSTGSKIIITGYFKDAATGQYVQHMQSLPLFITYTVHSPCGIGKLVLRDTNPNLTTEGILNSKQFPMDIDDVKLRYIGSQCRGADVTDVVYVESNVELSDGFEIPTTIKDDPRAFVYTVRVENADPSLVEVKLSGLSGILNAPLMSYHSVAEGAIDKTYVDLLFAKRSGHENSVLDAYKQLSVDALSGANGYTFDNPTHKSMNSFDMFDTQLMMKSIPLDDEGAVDTSHMQTNTDIGYTPSYTYNTFQNVLSIQDDLDSSHQMVELLGKSCELDSLLENVNENPDPYMSKQDMIDKYMYGRVYENGAGELSDQAFSIENDDSLELFSNKSFYQNMPNEYFGNQHINYVNGFYVWDIVLTPKYSLEKLRTMKLIAYTTNALGRNPYVVEMLSSTIDKSKDLKPSQFLSSNYNKDISTTTHQFAYGSFIVDMNGTQNGIDQVNSDFSNALPNIDDISYKITYADDKNLMLQFIFKVHDINAYGYIPADTIKIALVDQFNLAFFSWYHYIDQSTTVEDAVQVLNNISGTPLLKEQLLKVDFSQYSHLSDVNIDGFYIFQTDHRLQFKVDEEALFNISSFNYYVPTLNTKYPMTIGQTFDKLNSGELDDTKNEMHVYDADEVFQLQVEDSSILDSLSSLNVQYDDVVDDFRVFEDYFDDQDDAVNVIKYPADDPQFYQYVHLMSINGITSGQIEIDDKFIDDIRVQDDDEFSAELARLNLIAKHSENYPADGTQSSYIDLSKLDDDDKAKLIEKAQKFMKFHVCYQKEDNGITLYVNYQNYINSPYTKMVDGKMYLDNLPVTYAKIPPGESRLISIMLQFRQFLSGILIGTQNIIVATYKIYNVSDDKPKFIIDKLTEI